MASYKITEEWFRDLKRELKHSDPLTVAIKNHLSMSTILKVKSSKDYGDYEALKKSTHPPVKESMRDAVVDLNKKMDKVLREVNDLKGRFVI